jgi:hypothetical protein
MRNSKSFRLFLISFIIILITLFLATFWNSLGFGKNKIPLAVAITITFGISLAGLILSFTEIKGKHGIEQWIGLIGNTLIILFFIFIIIFSLSK